MVEETPYQRILVQEVLASPSSVIGCATGTVSGTMQGSGAMPCLRIRCLTVSRIPSAAAEMVIGAVSQRRAIHLGALDPLPDLVEARRGCKAIGNRGGLVEMLEVIRQRLALDGVARRRWG